MFIQAFIKSTEEFNNYFSPKGNKIHTYDTVKEYFLDNLFNKWYAI